MSRKDIGKRMAIETAQISNRVDDMIREYTIGLSKNEGKMYHDLWWFTWGFTQESTLWVGWKVDYTQNEYTWFEWFSWVEKYPSSKYFFSNMVALTELFDVENDLLTKK